MATRSIVAFKNTAGRIIGTYVHSDGDPEAMLPILKERLKTEGCKNIIAWINAGVAGNGYSSVNSMEPYDDNDPACEPVYLAIDSQDYGYLVKEQEVVLIFDKNS